MTVTLDTTYIYPTEQASSARSGDTGSNQVEQTSNAPSSDTGSNQEMENSYQENYIEDVNTYSNINSTIDKIV